MGDSALPSLREFVQQISDGVRGPASLKTPVLLHCGEEAPDEPMDFQTNTSVASWSIRVAVATAAYKGAKLNPEMVARAGQLYRVAKRAGGPFPNRIGVGRARTADVPITLAGISKYHAYFEFEDGQVKITDARSHNGTIVDGKRLPSGASAVIGDGGQLFLGSVFFLFFTAEGFRKLVHELGGTA